MNGIYDGLPEEVQIRIAAASIAAESTRESTNVSMLLRKARQVEVYLRTGNTDGRG